MALFEYERQRADLQDKHAQDQATNQYARFLSQTRFKRQNEDMDRGFQRSFPKFTGQWANRLGSNVRSGAFQRDLGNFTGDYNRTISRASADQSAYEADFESMTAMRKAAYDKMLLMLQEQEAAERAKTNPYALYM